jgi:hypothetical protein
MNKISYIVIQEIKFKVIIILFFFIFKTSNCWVGNLLFVKLPRCFAFKIRWCPKEIKSFIFNLCLIKQKQLAWENFRV